MNKLKDLRHVEEEIEGGGFVYILDKGEVIDSEAEAMLQALHSRSTGGLKHHLSILEEKGADNFMSRFYVGYGHKSIGDCGSLTLFIEGVSMLAAKAIQDSKLYNGQEASTRYIDFSKQNFINPLGNSMGLDILEMQRSFYISILQPLKDYLKSIYPISEGEAQGVYDKAISARAFDIARGFLPSGASTNLAWHTNLRQVADRLLVLRNHPLEEVRRIADAVERAVLKRYPNSFGAKKYEKTEEYTRRSMESYYYHKFLQEDFEVVSNNLDSKGLLEFRDLISLRPAKTELPVFLNTLGEISFSFKLDFGSFRDLQRHRAINQKMPLVTTKLGFNEFYLQALPENLRSLAKEHLKELEILLSSLEISKEELQYYIPMGYNISNFFTGNLPSIIYMVELRATRFVHPTLRELAFKIANYLDKECDIRIHLDPEKDRFDIKRGEHDISLK